MGNNRWMTRSSTRTVLQAGVQRVAIAEKSAPAQESARPWVAAVMTQPPPAAGDTGPDRGKPAGDKDTIHLLSPTTSQYDRHASRGANLPNASGAHRICRNAGYRHATYDHGCGAVPTQSAAGHPAESMPPKSNQKCQSSNHPFPTGRDKPRAATLKLSTHRNPIATTWAKNFTGVSHVKPVRPKATSRLSGTCQRTKNDRTAPD